MSTKQRQPESLDQEPERNRTTERLYLGEAWMMCNDCGGKLWSFDGDQDGSRGCPYLRDGTCQPR